MILKTVKISFFKKILIIHRCQWMSTPMFVIRITQSKLKFCKWDSNVLLLDVFGIIYNLTEHLLPNSSFIPWKSRKSPTRECDECRDNWVNMNIEFQLLHVMETDKQLPGPMNTDSSEISHYFRYSVSSNSQWQTLSSVLPITTSQCSRSNKNLKFSNNYCLLSSNHFVSLQIIF